jgi:uncharacterized lipoprotein YddW (UPF0748 family)
MKINFIKLFFCVLLLSGLVKFSQAQNKKYEFRAAWIASVVNIDFPSLKFQGKSSDTLKQEFIRILNMHQANGMNAVIVQVRPAADALYPSPYEPWSEFLTGKQGRPPAPYFDPLQFMIEETHKRGMEFHAWCNPYRAVFDVNKSSVAPNHITRIKPRWFIKYTNENRTTKYFDPGNPEVWDYVTNVMKDIVGRYDVDALHFDDYFYPYKNPRRDFQDQSTYRKNSRGLKKDDWRRSNVDTIISKISAAIKQVKPTVKFGISPFGIWRNLKNDSINGSNTNGSSCYDDLYADVLLWLKKGWIDYVAPQLYWEIGHNRADFITLLDWWNNNHYGKHLYIGQAIYRGSENHSGWRANQHELLDQIDLIREKSTTLGSIFFSSKSFESNPRGWNDSLKNNYYSTPAIVPPMPWIDNTKPTTPNVQFTLSNSELQLNIKNTNAIKPIKQYVIYLTNGDGNISSAENIYTIVMAENNTPTINTKDIPATWKKASVLVTTLDKTNNESLPSNSINLSFEKNKWIAK